MWLKFLFLTLQDGSWKLTPELGFILNINTDILNSFLEEKGIRSLGKSLFFYSLNDMLLIVTEFV